jgi:hypothetical protein
MGMVTEMHLGGEPQEPKERFNYKGMHRYLITLLPARKGIKLAEKETVAAVLPVLRESCREHEFEAYAYTFLPDRLVMIIRGKSIDADMKKFIAKFRAGSTAALDPRPGVRVWARTYRERVLRKTENTRTMADELFRLAVKGGLAVRPSAYEFQGSFVLGSVEPPPPHFKPPSRLRPSGKRTPPSGRGKPRRSGGVR